MANRKKVAKGKASRLPTKDASKQNPIPSKKVSEVVVQNERKRKSSLIDLKENEKDNPLHISSEDELSLSSTHTSPDKRQKVTERSTHSLPITSSTRYSFSSKSKPPSSQSSLSKAQSSQSSLTKAPSSQSSQSLKAPASQSLSRTNNDRVLPQNPTSFETFEARRASEPLQDATLSTEKLRNHLRPLGPKPTKGTQVIQSDPIPGKGSRRTQLDDASSEEAFEFPSYRQNTGKAVERWSGNVEEDNESMTNNRRDSAHIVKSTKSDIFDSSPPTTNHRRSGYRREPDSDTSDFETKDWLWKGVGRRSDVISTPEHEPVVHVCGLYLKAVILTGHAGAGSTPWPEGSKSWFSKVMAESWMKMSLRLGNKQGRRNPGVMNKPTAVEARKFYDSFSGWRTHFIEKVRSIVQTRYDWQVQKTSEATRRLARSLLHNDQFACIDFKNDPPTGRFAAPIIADVLAQGMFRAGKGNFTTLSYTKKFFDPLPVNLIFLAIVVIGHVIGEYESGERKTMRLDGLAQDEFWNRVKATWDAQCSERKIQIQRILLKRIRQQTREGGDHISLNGNPIIDSLAQGTSDLPLAELDDDDLISQPVNPVYSEGATGHQKTWNKTAKASTVDHAAALTNKKGPELNESGSKRSDLIEGSLEGEDNEVYVLQIQTSRGEVTHEWARWDWAWEDIKKILTLSEEGRTLWYNNGNGDRIVDDEVGYRRFLEWAEDQTEVVKIAIQDGYPQSPSP